MPTARVEHEQAETTGDRFHKRFLEIDPSQSNGPLPTGVGFFPTPKNAYVVPFLIDGLCSGSFLEEPFPIVGTSENPLSLSELQTTFLVSPLSTEQSAEVMPHSETPMAVQDCSVRNTLSPGEVTSPPVSLCTQKSFEDTGTLSRASAAPTTADGSLGGPLQQQVNSLLLQSIHLEALSTSDLKAVLALSEELRSNNAGEANSLAPSSSSYSVHFRPAYSWGDHPVLPLGGPTDFEVTPRGSVREATMTAEQRSQVLDAMDETDGFSDILRTYEQCGSHGEGIPTMYSMGPKWPLRFTKSPFGRKRHKGSHDIPKAATADIATAAATAAEFMDTSTGRGSPSVFVQRVPRRRPRQGPPRRNTSLRGPTDCSTADATVECHEEAPVKKCCRGLTSGRVASPNLGQNASCEASARHQTNFRGEESDSVTNPTVSSYFILKGPLDSAGLSLQGPTDRQDAGSGNNSSSRVREISVDRHNCTASITSCEEISGCVATSCRRVSCPPPELLLNSYRSPVKGVYYDSFKKLWRVQWHAPGDPGGPTSEGKRMSRSFSCTRLGFDLARAKAVAWMLSGGLVGDSCYYTPSASGCRSDKTPDVPRICATLASAESWEQVYDDQAKQYAVFVDPKRFLMKVEGYYLSRKLCGGTHHSVLPKSSPNNTSGINMNNSSQGSDDPASAETGPMSSISFEEGTSGPAPRGSCAGKRGPRVGPLSNKQKGLSPISLDEMLQIIWGSPQQASEGILRQASTEAGLFSGKVAQETTMTVDPTTLTAVPASTEVCLVRPEAGASPHHMDANRESY